MSEISPDNSERTAHRTATEAVITKRLRSSSRRQRAAVAASVLCGIGGGATLRDGAPVGLSIGLLAGVLPIAGAQRLERRNAYKTCDAAAYSYRELLQRELEGSTRAAGIQAMNMDSPSSRSLPKITDVPRIAPPRHTSREYGAFFTGSMGGFVLEKAINNDIGLENYQAPLILLGIGALGATFAASETSHPAMNIDTYTTYLDRVDQELHPQQ